MKQQGGLKRSLGLWALVGLGLGYMTPTILFDTFGIVTIQTDGVVPLAYLVALVVMFFTAISYGRMATVYPTAGSAYTYTRESMHPRLGFMVGWAALRRCRPARYTGARRPLGRDQHARPGLRTDYRRVHGGPAQRPGRLAARRRERRDRVGRPGRHRDPRRGLAAMLRDLARFGQARLDDGAPWPATTAPAYTSVGAGGLRRFVRPVCLPYAPEAVLPPAVRDDNPWHVPQRVDGRFRSTTRRSAKGPR